MSKIIWFFRHAQSQANASKDYRADDFSVPLVPLSDLGLRQARSIPDFFDKGPDLVITSPFIRTKQTARHLIEKYPATPQEEWPIQEFTYLSLKRCFHTTFAERRPLKDEYWNRNDPAYNDGDGAESFLDFIGRTQDAIANLKSRTEMFIVLFSHEYTIGAFRYLLEKSPKEIGSREMEEYREHFFANRIPNASKVEFIL